MGSKVNFERAQLSEGLNNLKALIFSGSRTGMRDVQFRSSPVSFLHVLLKINANLLFHAWLLSDGFDPVTVAERVFSFGDSSSLLDRLRPDWTKEAISQVAKLVS